MQISVLRFSSLLDTPCLVNKLLSHFWVFLLCLLQLLACVLNVFGNRRLNRLWCLCQAFNQRAVGRWVSHLDDNVLNLFGHNFELILKWFKYLTMFNLVGKYQHSDWHAQNQKDYDLQEKRLWFDFLLHFNSFLLILLNFYLHVVGHLARNSHISLIFCFLRRLKLRCVDWVLSNIFSNLDISFENLN